MGRAAPWILMFAVCACACGGPTTPNIIDPNDEVITGECGYRVRRGDATQSVGFGGGTVAISVTTTSGASAVACNWTVTMTDAARSFMTLVDPESATSSAAQATVRLNVAANIGGQRQGVVTIAGITYTITQAAAPCSLALGGDLNTTFPAGGGTGRVTITRTQGASCAWAATSNAAFVAGVTPPNGSDDGAVTFTVLANAGQSRSGTLTIAGQTVTVNQLGVNVVVPTVSSVSPVSLTVGVTATVTINGTGFDPATVQLTVTGPACPAAAPCLVSTAELTTRTPTLLVGPVTLRNAGSFTLQVQNLSTGPLSNSVTLTVSSPTTSPVISAIAPTQMPPGSAALTITGSGFDPASAQIVVTGPGCPAASPCLVLNAQLITRTATQLVAPVTLLTAGAFTIQVQNGSSGPLSNGVTVTVVPARTPAITSVSPATIPIGVTTALTIAGADFDPASAQVAVGSGCAAAAPCLVPNSELTSKTASQIVAPVTLRTAGTFTIQIQNGSAGTLSNAVSLTVR